MPDRPGLDDDEALKAVIEIWRDGSADLDARYDQVLRQIGIELGRLDADPAAPNAANAVRRLRRQARRLEELSDVASSIIDDAAQGTNRFITDGGFDRIYGAGADRVTSLPFSFTAPHRAAIDVLARDTFADVLTLTEFVDDDSKAFVRRVSRRLTGFKLTSGTPVKEQARRLRRELAQEFRARGVGTIRYADGSRHSFGEYAEMLLRTKTGVAYNAGTMNQGRLAGIRYYEILDGALCGLTSHDDPEPANGAIVTFEVAAAWPLAHPNCRRSVNPRPDITDANRATAPSVQPPEAREDQRRFEEALRRQGEQRRQRQRRQRAPRSRRTRSRPQRPTRARRGATRGQPVARGPSSSRTMGEQMDYRTGAARKNLGPAVDAVDRLHKAREVTSEKPLATFWGTGNRNKGGHFASRAADPRPRRPRRGSPQADFDKWQARSVARAQAGVRPEIKVNKRKGDTLEAARFAMWHEMGHWQDYDVKTGEFISRVAGRISPGFAESEGGEIGAMRKFLDAAKETDTIKAVRENFPDKPSISVPFEQRRYMLSSHETWARAYSQWVATRTDMPGARDGLEVWRSYPGFQWSDLEFEDKLAPLITDVLRARGVL